jgi:hypothetical protein
MKKEAPLKMQRGLTKKTSDEKRGTHKNTKRLNKKYPQQKKRHPENSKELNKKDLRRKRGTQKMQNGLTKSKTSFTNQVIEGEGDTFWFNHKEPNKCG